MAVRFLPRVTLRGRWRQTAHGRDWALLALLCLLLTTTAVRAAEPSATFYRGYNLGGPPLEIDGRAWLGNDAPDLKCVDARFENQSVVLRPETDPPRAKMIRASRYAGNGENRVVVSQLPSGTYTVFLYAWEDNDPQTYRVALQGREVLANYNSGPGGHWDKLGPWTAEVTAGTIELTSRGGHANWSGLEIWKGTLPDGKPPADDPETARARQHFDRRIAPLFARQCLTCHNASDKKGGLDLSQASAALAGGESGPSFVPGKLADSLLWERVASDEMPPKHPLPAAEKELLRDWIATGASWGRSPIDPFLFSSEKRAGYDWWSLQPISQPDLPKVENASWPKNELDFFLLAKLEASGLRPAPEADRQTLVRRLYFDLIGLPPTPDEVAAFLADPAPGAYEKLVDRLLESPHYGERWARHWLDVIRFGESDGFERNYHRPQMWKYRDWVIQALNDDLPYDEFVRLQLAGDALHPEDPRAVIATGYLAAGPYDLAGHDFGTEEMKSVCRQDELEDFVGTLGQTFMGLTLNCARCHDHKFDPVFQKEYFQVAAALGGVRVGERNSPPLAEAAAPGLLKGLADKRGVLHGEAMKIDAAVRERLGLEAKARAIQAAEAAEMKAAQSVSAAEKKVAEAEAQAASAKEEEKKKASEALKNAQQELEKKRSELVQARAATATARETTPSVSYDQILDQLPLESRAEYRRLVFEISRFEIQMRLLEGGPVYASVPRQPPIFYVLARGDFRQPGEMVAPRGVASVAGSAFDFGLNADAPEAERRVKLAAWVTDPHNPLTPRVLVNRLWRNHFGQGFVETPSDFGFNGGRPSHPELLDWLAAAFVRGNWRIKPLQRLIVTSAGYRQASRPRPEAAAKDGENRLLWRKDPQRLDAETTRDAILAIAGELNPRMGGPGFLDVAIRNGLNTQYEPLDVSGAEFNRRTIYRSWIRSGTNSLLDTLDCPDPTVATPKRTVTTTPLQALALLNNPFMLNAAQKFAERLDREAGQDVASRIGRAYRLVYGRAASEAEAAAASQFVAAYGWRDFCLVLLNSSEFVYVD